MVSYVNQSDQELFNLLKQGDHDAFNEIYKRYQPVLFNHAYRRFPDREQVRDIIQELFTYIWKNRSDIHLSGSLAGYLYSSVRNKVLNHFRDDKVKEAFNLSLTEFLENEKSMITDHLIREKELIALIEEEVSKLPVQMQLIFRMSREAHMNHNEIAKQLGLSPHTVRTQVKNALRILRTKLGSAVFILFF